MYKIIYKRKELKNMSVNYEQCWKELDNYFNAVGCSEDISRVMKDIEKENTIKDKPTLMDLFEACNNGKLFIKLDNGEIHKILQSNDYWFVDDMQNEYSYLDDVEFIIN
jgi:hypothetical protein